VSFQLSLNTESVTAAYPETPIIVAPDATVEEVLQLLRTERTASVLVYASGTRIEDTLRKDAPEKGAGQDRPDGRRDDSMLGIFTERDALKWMAAGQPLDQPVSEVMYKSPVAVTDQATVGQAIQKMAAGGYRHLPILAADGTPVGMAVVHGIVHYLVDHFPETIYTLPPTPDSVPSEREGA
jgi:CBS domain-containing protein